MADAHSCCTCIVHEISDVQTFMRHLVKRSHFQLFLSWGFLREVGSMTNGVFVILSILNGVRENGFVHFGGTVSVV